MVCLPFHHNRLYKILSKKKASFLLVTRRNGAEDRNRTGTDITIRGILSPVRLPVPPPRHIKLEATPRFELGNKGFADLCLTTWLCRLIWSGKRDSNSRPSPWQGDALPLSYFRTLCVLFKHRTSGINFSTLFSFQRTALCFCCDALSTATDIYFTRFC